MGVTSLCWMEKMCLQVALLWHWEEGLARMSGALHAVRWLDCLRMWEEQRRGSKEPPGIVSRKNWLK